MVVNGPPPAAAAAAAAAAEAVETATANTRVAASNLAEVRVIIIKIIKAVPQTGTGNLAATNEAAAAAKANASSSSRDYSLASGRLATRSPVARLAPFTTQPNGAHFATAPATTISSAAPSCKLTSLARPSSILTKFPPAPVTCRRSLSSLPLLPHLPGHNSQTSPHRA